MGPTYVKAIRSACWKARVLGMTSPKTRISVVTPIVATRAPQAGPTAATAIMVPRAAAATLTRLLPRRIAASNLLGCSTILSSRSAPFLPVLTRCLTLSLGKEIKAVSALEKKADNPRQTAKTIKYQLSMFSICCPTEYPAGPFNIIIALAIHSVKETNAARRSTFSPLPPGGVRGPDTHNS